jgi:5-methylcytosine-specific restriction endonuclease McrA
VHKLEKAITNKAYRATSKAKSYARAYSFRNKEGLNAYGRAYYVENKERVLVYGSAWQKANPEACAKNRQKRRVNKEGNKTFLITAKELACIRESLCTHCGAPGPNQVDHVIPVSKGGTDGVGNLMPLCKRCNQSKGASFYSVFKVRQAKALLVSKTQSKDFLPA